MVGKRNTWMRRVSCLALGWMGAGCVTAASEMPPQVWMNHYRMGDLVATNQWTFVRSRLDTAIYYINTLWPNVHPDVRISADQVAASASVLDQADIGIALEGGYFDRDAVFAIPGDARSEIKQMKARKVMKTGVGRATARIELNKLKPLWASGHPPRYLILDDPMRRLTVPGQDIPGTSAVGMANETMAAQEVVGYMREMRATMPEVAFVLILNFPNWGWKGEPAYHRSPGIYRPMNWGDAHRALTTLLDVLSANDLTPYAIQADHPWRYYAEPPTDALAATVDWPKRVRELESMVHARGIRFHLVTNSETGYVSAERFCEDSLSYLDTYLADGGRPDAVVVQSWYPHPKQLLPETEATTTTGLTQRFIKRLDVIRTGIAPIPSRSVEEAPLSRTEAEAWSALLEHYAFLNPGNPKVSTIAQRLRTEWLDLPNQPDRKGCADLLKAAMHAASELRDALPVVRLRWTLDGLEQTEPHRLSPTHGMTLIELFNLTDTSRQVTAWQRDSDTRQMKPIWIPPFGSRFLLTAIDTRSFPKKALSLCVGGPELTDPMTITLPMPPAQ